MMIKYSKEFVLMDLKKEEVIQVLMKFDSFLVSSKWFSSLQHCHIHILAIPVNKFRSSVNPFYFFLSEWVFEGTA